MYPSTFPCLSPTILKFNWQTSAAYTSQIFLGYYGVGCELMVQQHPSLSSCGIRRLCSHGGEQLDLPELVDLTILSIFRMSSLSGSCPHLFMLRLISGTTSSSFGRQCVTSATAQEAGAACTSCKSWNIPPKTSTFSFFISFFQTGLFTNSFLQQAPLRACTAIFSSAKHRFRGCHIHLSRPKPACVEGGVLRNTFRFPIPSRLPSPPSITKKQNHNRNFIGNRWRFGIGQKYPVECTHNLLLSYLRQVSMGQHCIYNTPLHSSIFDND